MADSADESSSPVQASRSSRKASTWHGPDSDDAAQVAFVSVFVRVKPTCCDEPISAWAEPIPGEGRRKLCLQRELYLEEYEFTNVLGPDDDNCTLFQDLQGTVLTRNVFNGINESLFAYGQTGSGKTHSIFGTEEESGLLQHFVHSIFQRVDHFPAVEVYACCYEVLGDLVIDLVDADHFLSKGMISEEDISCEEIFIKTQRCRYEVVRVPSMEMCLSLLEAARAKRSVGLSACNVESSRSHAVVHLCIRNPHVRNVDSFEARSDATAGALTLVDLAGSEKEFENPSMHQRRAARQINQSLSSLNRLLRKLQAGCLDESERRQSVLNKCLWKYLSPGNGVTMVFCASALLKHRAMTLSTLSIATDCKLVQSHRKKQFVEMPPSPSRSALPGSPASPASLRTPLGSLRSFSKGSNRFSVGSPPDSPRSCSKESIRLCSKNSARALGGRRDFDDNDDFLKAPLVIESLSEANFKLSQQLSEAQLHCQELLCQADHDRELAQELSETKSHCQELMWQAQRASDEHRLERDSLLRECAALRVLVEHQQQRIGAAPHAASADNVNADRYAIWKDQSWDRLEKLAQAGLSESRDTLPSLGDANLVTDSSSTSQSLLSSESLRGFSLGLVHLAEINPVLEVPSKLHATGETASERPASVRHWHGEYLRAVARICCR